MLSYNPACEPLEPVKTQKNGNTAKFMVATYDLPRNIDHGTFTPLVFTTSGGTGPAAFLFFKHLASMLAAKHQKPYAHVSIGLDQVLPLILSPTLFYRLSSWC